MRITRENLLRAVSGVRKREFWLFSALAFIVLCAAFQIPYKYALDLGSREGRFFIARGVYNPEPNQAKPFRWTDGNATFVIPALDAGEWTIQLHVNGWQPESSAHARLIVGDKEFEKQLEGDWSDWKEQISTAGGDLEISLLTGAFKPSDFGNSDARTLGIQIDSLIASPNGFGLRVPPLVDYVLPMTLAIALAWLLLNVLGLRMTCVVIGSGILLLGFVVLIGFYAKYLNVTLVRLITFALALELVLIILGLSLFDGLCRRAGISIERTTLTALVFIVASVAAVKLVGIFYPQMYVIDAVFHQHRMEEVMAGNLFFVTRSREFGSLETVYPPALYIFLSPLTTPGADPLSLVKAMLPLLEGAGGLVLFGLARLAGLSERAALIAVLLYLVSPLAWITFGWGVYANIFAELLFVLMLALWFGFSGRGALPLFVVLFAFVFVLGILAHASMLVVLGAFWSIFGASVWLSEKKERRRVWVTGLACAAALVISFVLYFAVFVDKTLANVGALETRASEAAGSTERVVGGGLDDKELGLVPVRVKTTADWLREGIFYLARESWVYYRTAPILLAGLGIWWMWRQEGLRVLALCLLAGLATVLIFFLVGLTLNLYTRYMLFGAPFFALGAGFALDRVAQRGTLGRAIVLAVTVGILLSGFGFWVTRVVT